MKALGSHQSLVGRASTGHEIATQFDPLSLISRDEFTQMLNAAITRQLPYDFQQKLDTLKNGDLQQSRIEQNCRVFFALLEAALAGEFTSAARHDIEQLVRVLAYVRKEDDVVPDYRSLGFTDDYQEIRSASAELGSLIEHFKRWRLRHQVPGLWLSAIKQPPMASN